MRVVAAMSGGVDSAVAAAQLVAAGHEVTGVHLSLKGKYAAQGRGCGSATDADDARHVAEQLGIGFEVWDLADHFQEQVVDHFIAEYAAGRTPNPCLRCNSTIKFAVLIERALERGFAAVGTGHYARVLHSDHGSELYRAKNIAKDQSYVLAVLTPEQLAHTLFPLGEFATKAEVRAQAADLNFREVAAKPDSLDICFIPDGDTQGFLDRTLGQVPGDIVDTDGTVLGHHEGTHHFTVGQRKGLSLGRPAADGRPRYVLGLSPDTRTVTVGPKEGLEVTTIRATNVNWLVTPQSKECVVQVRAHGTELPATIGMNGADFVVELVEPTYGVAAGQGVVAYQDGRVLVQATITSAT
ncbi:MAG: tRNA 2-thiouridine(34) synthase MnmA [Propionibacteriaceae bacterium]